MSLSWHLRMLPRSCQFALVLALTGCAAKQAPSFALAIRVESDPGQALGGVAVALLRRPLGVTDDTGVLATSLRGLPGETVELSVICPTGYRSPTPQLIVRLRQLAEREKRPEYRVLCAPTVRTLVLAVRANGAPQVPVHILGEEIARTDKDGVAHARLLLAPGETIIVKLDTSDKQHATLMPHDPELRIVMPEHDEVVLIDQTFKRPAPPKRARRAPEPVGPQPI